MTQIDFAVKINLSLDLSESAVSLSIRNVELHPAMISLPTILHVDKDVALDKEKGKKTLHDIVEDTAREFVAKTGKNEFSAADLLRQAREKYPDMNPRSFRAHVIAAAPEHGSWKHYPNRKRYLIYLGKGKYKLRAVERQPEPNDRKKKNQSERR